MLTWILIMIAVAFNSGAAPEMAAEAPVTGPVYEAEPQEPTGKFTTAAEIKQIMTLTKANWIAVREYDGQDLVYITQILSWRCGLVGLHFSVNGAPLEPWVMPACHEGTAAPNAITADDGPIYRTFPLGSVQSVSVEIVYDDLTRDSADYERSAVLMP
ncbi:hypothetical protein ATO6_14550 [Oceanicola sp. 22II-s10i]|uniref:hypothetical protein n=1 Tax=Oceanicola sp. 22II-s10i TaxID=1317116 RepID=UPI000B6D2682|nr:hypothetical protein [Oceanicola sp. 22II-s10i]OWU84249.1 hypothetical protein ATO6_14550 [Oceanicola sp. 22II-s10i]